MHPCAKQSRASEAPERWPRRLLRHAGWAVWVLLAVMAALSRATFGLRCESFGCTYVGVVWVALAAIWGVVVLLGLGLLGWQRHGSVPTRLTAAAVAALLVAAAGHVAYWLA
ncbi:hypothetical protein [Acidovorax sp. BL-A-41-H1]|uniref:hypothetical protein n=1 Tax=Acidovorax sp. BL-A-41-H1 TaxID=3421102 RepID=UPI003F7A2B95